MLRMIKCYMCPVSLENVKEIVSTDVIRGITVRESMGYGLSEEDSEEIDFQNRTEIDVIVDQSAVDQVIDELEKLAQKEACPIGKLFVIPVEDAVRLETGERGRRAIK